MKEPVAERPYWPDAMGKASAESTEGLKDWAWAAEAHCAIGTEKADETVILEGEAELVSDRTVWKTLAGIYDRKYGGDLYPLLESCGGNVYRVRPRVAFGQDEHAEDFVKAVTKWKFTK